MELGSNSIWLNLIFDFADSVWASLNVIYMYSYLGTIMLGKKANPWIQALWMQIVIYFHQYVLQIDFLVQKEIFPVLLVQDWLPNEDWVNMVGKEAGKILTFQGQHGHLAAPMNENCHLFLTVSESGKTSCTFCSQYIAMYPSLFLTPFSLSLLSSSLILCFHGSFQEKWSESFSKEKAPAKHQPSNTSNPQHWFRIHFLMVSQ